MEIELIVEHLIQWCHWFHLLHFTHTKTIHIDLQNGFEMDIRCVNWSRRALLCKSRLNVCNLSLTNYHSSTPVLTLKFLDIFLIDFFSDVELFFRSPSLSLSPYYFSVHLPLPLSLSASENRWDSSLCSTSLQ